MSIREKLLAVLHEDRAQHNKGAVPAESHDEKEKSSKGATEMKQPAKDAAADPVDIVSQGHEDASKAGRVTAPAPGRNSADGVRSGDQQIIPSATPQKALSSTMEAYKSMYAPVEEEVSEESVELEERSLSPAEKKAMKELIAKAIGARQPYLDAIIRDKGLKGEVLSNGDFIVKGKNGKVEGRIAKGKFDPSVIGESVEVSEDAVEIDESVFDEISEEMVELEEASKTIEKVKEIVAKKQAMKIDGIMVDLFTAGAIAKAYDEVNDTNRKKMDTLKIAKLADIAMKVLAGHLR